MRRHTCCGVCFFFSFAKRYISCVYSVCFCRDGILQCHWQKRKSQQCTNMRLRTKTRCQIFFSFSDYIFCYLHVPKSRRQPCATLDPTLQLVFRHIRSASFKQTLVFTQQYTPEHSLQLQPSFIFLSRVTAPTIHVSPHRPHLLRQQQSVEHPQLLTPPHARSFSPPHPS